LKWLAVLGYHTGGTAQWDYVYVFCLATGRPELVSWFEAGTRADSGLYRVQATTGALTVDLQDPERQIAACCSEGYVRTHYAFKKASFEPIGQPEYGTFEKLAAARPTP
jgi:hypothetical protein